ncbi:hypothetical protein B0H11DRAFT_1943100 [Mycena galericulata]|nr:hypothetical protein B0H11DRAFT_1943100 [Mycena galericulata]
MPASTSDNERSDSEPPQNRPRRIVDFEPDDGDADWEDVPSLGASTHCSRNPSKLVIPVRKRQRRPAGVNAHVTVGYKGSTKPSRMKALAVDLAAFEAEREQLARDLAEKHGVKLKEVRRRMLLSSGFTTKRRVSLYNAKISAIMADVNAGRDVGSRVNLKEAKAMVKADPSLLDAFSANSSYGQDN